MTEPAEDPVQIVVTLSAALLERVNAVAAATMRSRSDLITDAIAFVVAEHEERVAGEAAQVDDEREPPDGPAYFSGG